MGFWDFLTGNKIRKCNNEKISRIKKELLLMTKSQKVSILSGREPLNFDILSKMIVDIYECDSHLSSDFLTYYLISTDEDIKEEIKKISEKHPFARDSKGRFCKRSV